MNINGLYAALKAVVPSSSSRDALTTWSTSSRAIPTTTAMTKGPSRRRPRRTRAAPSWEVTNTPDPSSSRRDGTSRTTCTTSTTPSSRTAKADALTARLKGGAAEAARLEAEPKNEQLVVELTEMERMMGSVNDDLEEARAHAA
ncbi:hypothetical protein ACHAWF_002492, partial [Thalassiosira exigua]